MLQSQNVFMREWVEERPRYIAKLLDIEASPSNLPCSSCAKEQSMWQCEDCYARPLFCDTCILEQHIHNPFHRIEVWCNTYFKRAALWQTGLTLHLGHGGGLCPYYGHLHGDRLAEEVEDDEDTPDNRDQEREDEEVYTAETGSLSFDVLKPPTPLDPNGNPWFLIVHTTGIHYLSVQFCQCYDHEEHYMQLLDRCLYPATQRCPRTAFTFQLLDDFYIENLECKTPARNYYSKLRRLTSNTFPHLVAVSEACLSN